jgi:hypothetical protein
VHLGCHSSNWASPVSSFHREPGLAGIEMGSAVGLAEPSAGCPEAVASARRGPARGCQEWMEARWGQVGSDERCRSD